MRETIQDVVKHTGGLGFIETVKITGTDEATNIEAMDNDRTVILKAKLLVAEPNLVGEFGMGNLSLLSGLVSNPLFRTDDATITVKRRDRNGKQVPEEITFTNTEKKTSGAYRLMASDLIPEQAKFLGVNWDVEIDPSQSKLKELQALAGLYSAFESFFMAKTVKNEDGTTDLVFFIGDEGSSMHRASLVIAEDVNGSLTGDLHWPINQVLNILKLGADENLKLQFSTRGALQITMTSPSAEYNFILPARKK